MIRAKNELDLGVGMAHRGLHHGERYSRHSLVSRLRRGDEMSVAVDEGEPPIHGINALQLSKVRKDFGLVLLGQEGRLCERLDITQSFRQDEIQLVGNVCGS